MIFFTVVAGFKATMTYEDCLKRAENITQVNGTNTVCDFKTIISEVISYSMTNPRLVFALPMITFIFKYTSLQCFIFKFTFTLLVLVFEILVFILYFTMLTRLLLSLGITDYFFSNIYQREF